MAAEPAQTQKQLLMFDSKFFCQGFLKHKGRGTRLPGSYKVSHCPLPSGETEGCKLNEKSVFQVDIPGQERHPLPSEVRREDEGVSVNGKDPVS